MAELYPVLGPDSSPHDTRRTGLRNRRRGPAQAGGDRADRSEENQVYRCGRREWKSRGPPEPGPLPSRDRYGSPPDRAAVPATRRPSVVGRPPPPDPGHPEPESRGKLKRDKDV